MIPSHPNCLLKTPCIEGRYQLQSLLGEGAFGEVYLAKSLGSSTPLAYKKLKASSLNNHAIRAKRFAREISICRRLKHPNVVKILDHGIQQDGNLFAVFEYIGGQTLKEYLAHQKMSPELAANVMAQVLSALAEAHRCGVIHRDLKPSNIMITFNHLGPSIKLLDFGVSQTREDTDLTAQNEILGTPAYTAPEQLRGNAATERSDIYSWGLLLYECLTGKPAVVGETYAEICHQQLLPTEIDFPASLKKHPVCDLLRSTLTKNPFKRIGSVEALIQNYTAINFSSLNFSTYRQQQNTEDTLSSFYTPKEQSRSQHALAMCIKSQPQPNKNTDAALRRFLSNTEILLSILFSDFPHEITSTTCSMAVCFSPIQHHPSTLNGFWEKLLTFARTCNSERLFKALHAPNATLCISVYSDNKQQIEETYPDWALTRAERRTPHHNTNTNGNNALINNALLLLLDSPPNSLSINSACFQQLKPQHQNGFVQTCAEIHNLYFNSD